jgi:PQQ-dependent dehydrogenase (methanol/ethanol family)
MQRMFRGFMILILVILLGGTGWASAPAHGAAPAAQAAASGASVDWPLFGNTSDNTRFSTLSQVNASNVSKLGVAWTMTEGTNLTTWETMPVVVGGVMYFTTNVDQVLAVDAATGKLLWKFTPKVNLYLAIAGGGGGTPTNRGVAVANNTVYELTFDNQLIALQAATGEKLWDTQVADPNAGYSETSPPTYWNGMLFLPSSEGEAGVRGFVAAYDAATGKQIWRFYTVPGRGQGWLPAKGEHGGGDVWLPPTIDTTTGILYFGTGNPTPDLVNSIRLGCDPYVDSVVAVEARTGKFLWAHNQVCPDLWDYDSEQAPLLFNVTQNGQIVRAVGEGNKSGYFWIFNAKTGATIAESPALVKETLPHPTPTLKGVLNCPGTSGGLEYSPPAYSPVTQAVYEPGLNLCQILQSIPVSQIQLHKSGAVDFGGIPYNGPGPYTGDMSAVDVNTGHLLWQTKVSGPMVGGALATAGNLVFSGCDNEHVYAFDATTGRILWQPDIGLAVGGAPIAYEVNGTEYIAIAAGGSNTATFEAGPNATPPAVGGTLVVFKLGGGPIKKLPAVTTGVLVPLKTELPSLKGMTKINPWMYANPKTSHVVIIAQAAATPNNSGFNFDGYANGKATFTVPAGWFVDFEFSNKAALPHSLGIASSLTNLGNLPYFGYGPAESPNASAGTGPNVTQVVGIEAAPAGKYYLVCLVPGHVKTGMWDYFTISTTATMPSIQTS